jgi:hypothetical protein
MLRVYYLLLQVIKIIIIIMIMISVVIMTE